MIWPHTWKRLFPCDSRAKVPWGALLRFYTMWGTRFDAHLTVVLTCLFPSARLISTSLHAHCALVISGTMRSPVFLHIVFIMFWIFLTFLNKNSGYILHIMWSFLVSVSVVSLTEYLKEAEGQWYIAEHCKSHLLLTRLCVCACLSMCLWSVSPYVLSVNPCDFFIRPEDQSIIHMLMPQDEVFPEAQFSFFFFFRRMT